MKNILVFPCGTEEALEINNALGRLVHCNLFGVDQAGKSKGMYIFQNYLGILSEDTLVCLEQIKKIIQDYSIDIIFPTQTEITEYLQMNQEHINADVIASPVETIRASRSKKILESLFDDYISFSENKEIKTVECTVCCLTDRHGQLRYSETIHDPLQMEQQLNIKEISKVINSRLVFRGAWSYQIRLKDERCNGLKITPGIVPEMAIHRGKGVNLVALSFFDKMGHDIEIRPIAVDLSAQSYLMFRYNLQYEYDHIYVDLDDTIIVKGKINPLIMTFLFQSCNEGKRVHLITKHRLELQVTLERFRIQNVFDSVIWLKHSDEKYRYMKRERAIFIDDAFSERKKVAELLGIPTFEVNAVECLIDWRL